METARLEAVISKSVKEKAVIDAADEKRSLSKHVEKVLEDWPSKNKVDKPNKKEYK